MDDKIKEKYQVQISEAEAFLNSKAKSAGRKTWSPMHREKWLMLQKICRTCDIKLDDKNLTKEHIHPLCLGGAERDDNVIGMCHECNESRNQTMNDVLGGNKPLLLRKRWPANRSSVEEFVVWCHATVYGDDETVSKLQHIDERFNKWRGFKKSKSLNTRFSNKEPKESIFKSVLSKTKSVLSKTKSVLSKPSSKVKVDCDKCGSVLQVPRDYSGRFKCPSCSHITGNEPKVKVETRSKSSESSSPIVAPPSDSKESESPLKDSFRKYILEKLSETGRIDLGVLAKPHLDNFVEKKGFTKFSETKVAMGYSLNKRMKDILADSCGELVIFTSEQIDDNPPKVYVETAPLVVELWNQIEDAILTNKREITDLDYVWRAKISPWSKTVGFSGAVELKKELGYSSKAKIVDLITELYGNKLLITRDEEKIQLRLASDD